MEKKEESGIPGFGSEGTRGSAYSSPKMDLKIGGETPKIGRKSLKNSPKSLKSGPKTPKNDQNPASDSATTTTFEAFYQPGKAIGLDQGYGGTINDDWRLFYSIREPVGYWWVTSVAYDIWDNWFKVKSVKDPDSPKLNEDVQKILTMLKAKTQFPRETIFERRYGTAILLLSYTGFDNDWEKPLFVPENGEKLPKLESANTKLLQITPYPWTAMAKDPDLVTDPSSIRFGLPEYYYINQGAPSTDDSAMPIGMTVDNALKVHWTRVIHDAPRLDEHPYLGIPAIDVIFDDLVGGRNARWGMYQGYYRNGQGFPKFQTKGSKKENEDWVAAGGPEKTLNSRGYFVCGENEDVQFVGAQASALNPTSYFDVYYTFVAAGTRVAADVIKGVSAGRISGSEVNERGYFKSITGQQKPKETMAREVIDRLIQTGQVEFDGEYIIEWIDPFTVNPQDRSAMEFLNERTNVLRLQTETPDEVRKRKQMGPLPDGKGKELVKMPGQAPSGTSPEGGGLQNQGGPPNQENPSRQPTEPEERDSEKTLLQKTLEEAG